MMAANHEFNIQFKLLSSITVNWNCQYSELGCVYFNFPQCYWAMRREPVARAVDYAMASSLLGHAWPVTVGHAVASISVGHAVASSSVG